MKARKAVQEKPEEEKKAGVTCDCGKHHPFCGYVYAHWMIRLTLRCECGQVWLVQRGIAWKKTSRTKFVK